jgi:hypothetical protein
VLKQSWGAQRWPRVQTELGSSALATCSNRAGERSAGHVFKQSWGACSRVEEADVGSVAYVLMTQTLERCSRVEEADVGALLTC